LPISRTGFALLEEIFSRKDAKAQREAFRNAVALCAFAREIFSVEVLFVHSHSNPTNWK